MRHIILSESMGVYLGSFLGMGFWSKLDPVDQPSAVTFGSPKEAQEAMATWDGLAHLPSDMSYPVVETQADGYASIAQCVAAGAEEWAISQ